MDLIKLVIPQIEHGIAVMDFREEFLKKKGLYTECWGVLKSTLPTFFSL